MLPLSADPAGVFAVVGDSDLGQVVQEVLRGAGGLVVDCVAVLVYCVLTAQCLLDADDVGPASQCHIGVAGYDMTRLHGQADVF